MTQMKKDRSWLRPALPDYILKFRKPGDNPVPVAGGMSGDEWIELANPTWPNETDRAAEWGAWATWYGIHESDTLQGLAVGAPMTTNGTSARCSLAQSNGASDCGLTPARSC